MNNVTLIGRLTKDPELRYVPETQKAVANFNIALDRGKDRNGESKGADFPRVIVFGKQAENCEKYLHKGRLVGIRGRIQTGSYKNKNGDTIYTTDVVAERVEFLEYGQKDQNQQEQGNNVQTYMDPLPPDDFTMLDEDVPF